MIIWLVSTSVVGFLLLQDNVKMEIDWAPKKKEVQKLSLGEFLGNKTALGSWADEMEDMPLPSDSGGFGERRAYGGSGGGFGGGERSYAHGGGDRGYAVREELPLPSKPPYTAHLGNLPFDATNPDIEDFFAGCEVTSVRIVEDKVERKPKGFGYVEFGTLEGLKKALELNQAQFQGRNIRISVADPPKDRGEIRTFDDWTRKGPLPDLPNATRRASDKGGFRNYEGAAPEMERGGSRRSNFEGDGKTRDLNNWERRGPLSPAPTAGPPVREGGRLRNNEAPRERKASPAWGEGRSQDGSRPPRGEFRERPGYDRQPTAAERDNQWRARMKPDTPSAASTPEPSAPSSPAQPPAPAMRPKLNLAKRTVSEAVPPAAAAPVSESKANPFGAARPIDTAAREREVEEKRQLAIRQKKEADAKAREEKEAAREAAAAPKAPASEAEASASAEATSASAEATSASAEATSANGGTSENGEARPVQILSRTETEVSTTGDATTSVTDEKAAKPKEFIREPPRGPKVQPAGGSWRRPKGSAPATPVSPSGPSEKQEEDGWTSVPARGKGGRGRGGSRAS
ncbi:hypothetical protein EJ06DRAFT_584774 [Trichodelitschia bisporula]|uniref:RRM domain-containing protein n=1 Tax=Trichodelitschia bisporula TaxID=703511 RepID=A0A6G1HL15_9PEZI|nr:hypothetical protein EJ06DRAFT_584774 [Trichodelitschia bisporula]